MATVTRKIDDIDGTEAEYTVEFAVDGENFTIDLSQANAARFKNAMAEFIAHSTKVVHPVYVPKAVKRSGATSGTNRGGFTPEKLAQIREWARANGHTVADRGRIKSEILEAYHSSQKEEAESKSAERSVIAILNKEED